MVILASCIMKETFLFSVFWYANLCFCGNFWFYVMISSIFCGVCSLFFSNFRIWTLHFLRWVIHSSLSSFLSWAAVIPCHCHPELVVLLFLFFIEKARHAQGRNIPTMTVSLPSFSLSVPQFLICQMEPVSACLSQWSGGRSWAWHRASAYFGSCFG